MTASTSSIQEQPSICEEAKLYRAYVPAESEGVPVQYAGVYVTRWQREWGEPTILFCEAEEEDQVLFDSIPKLMKEIISLSDQIEFWMGEKGSTWPEEETEWRQLVDIPKDARTGEQAGRLRSLAKTIAWKADAQKQYERAEEHVTEVQALVDILYLVKHLLNDRISQDVGLGRDRRMESMRDSITAVLAPFEKEDDGRDT